MNGLSPFSITSWVPSPGNARTARTQHGLAHTKGQSGQGGAANVKDQVVSEGSWKSGGSFFSTKIKPGWQGRGGEGRGGWGGELGGPRSLLVFFPFSRFFPACSASFSLLSLLLLRFSVFISPALLSLFYIACMDDSVLHLSPSPLPWPPASPSACVQGCGCRTQWSRGTAPRRAPPRPAARAAIGRPGNQKAQRDSRGAGGDGRWWSC